MDFEIKCRYQEKPSNINVCQSMPFYQKTKTKTKQTKTKKQNKTPRNFNSGLPESRAITVVLMQPSDVLCNG